MRIMVDNSVLVIVDVQEKLFNVVLNREQVLKNILKLVKISKLLRIPIIITEQYPQGLGKTVPELVQELGEHYSPIEKTTFSCFGSQEFRERVSEIGRKNLLITGIEAHICVYQTAVDAASLGYRPVVVYDATSSRLELDYRVMLYRLLGKGIDVATTDMVIFELVGDSKHPAFREVLKIVKD